jgi:hypothetical protein
MTNHVFEGPDFRPEHSKEAMQTFRDKSLLRELFKGETKESVKRLGYPDDVLPYVGNGMLKGDE